MLVYFKYLKGWYMGKDKCSLFFQKVIILGIAMVNLFISVHFDKEFSHKGI